MSGDKTLQLKHSIQTELIKINVILEKILLELAEIKQISHPNGRLGSAVMKAKDSFVPLFAALNIAAVADNQQEEVGEESLLQ